MEPLELTDDQKAEIRSESVSIARAVLKEKNPAAAGYLKLERSVEAKLLTPDQRSQFKAVKKKHPMRSLR